MTEFIGGRSGPGRYEMEDYLFVGENEVSIKFVDTAPTEGKDDVNKKARRLISLRHPSTLRSDFHIEGIEPGDIDKFFG